MNYLLDASGPRWVELMPTFWDAEAQAQRPAVEVLFPVDPSPKALRKARQAAREAQVAAHAAGADRLDVLFDSGDAFSRELIRWSILDWRGLGFSDEEPTPPTQDRETRDADGNLLSTERGSISAFLASPRLFEAADEKFVVPWTQRDAEKNGYARSSTGTSAKETPAGATARMPATRRAKAGATSARTSSTKRKPTKASVSGS